METYQYASTHRLHLSPCKGILTPPDNANYLEWISRLLLKHLHNQALSSVVGLI